MPRLTLSACLMSTMLVGLPAVASPEEGVPVWLTRSRELAQQLATDLKAELQRALESGGPVAAIEVCRNRAPEIAAGLSRGSGAVVSRTALRVRNPANAPDDLQKAILEQFSGDFASGRYELPLEAAVEINRAGRIERRYMRAIPMEGVCVTCHGQTLSPEIAAAIAAAYPQDRATGFEVGQLRGAISVTWPPSITADH